MRSIKLFEWQSAELELSKEQMRGFVLYLNETWQNRVRYLEVDDDSDNDQEASKEQRFFSFTGDGKITARNYVGAIQYEDIRIEVYPKTFKNNETHDYSTYQLNLLYWLSYCRKIRFPFSLVDLSTTDFDEYLELIIYIFSNYTNDILNEQPFQAYQEITEETDYLKGRLHFDNYVTQNVITGKWQNFHCTHSPFIYDNLFNRIVKFVATRLSSITRNSLNQERLSSILFLLHDVSDVPITASDCDKVTLNPLYSDLRNVLSLCDMILSNKMIDIKSDSNQNFCFLIPMEYVFEDFVFGFINDHWSKINFRSQSEGYLAMREDKGVFKIKNDIYLKDQLIIDTKYKIRKQENGSKGGVSQGDLYQMIAYAIRRDCPNVTLLYPTVKDADNRDVSFTIPSGDLSEELTIDIRSVDITFEDYANTNDVIKERFKAINLIFDEDSIKMKLA